MAEIRPPSRIATQTLDEGDEALNAFGRCRCGGAQEPRLELLAVVTVVDPFARGRDPLAGSDRRGVADHRHQIPMSPRLGPKDAEAVLFVVEGDALDEACQCFLVDGASGDFMRSSAFAGDPAERGRGWKDYVAAISCLIRWTVPVPSPSILATLSMPTPFSSCFLALRSRAMSTLGRPSRVP
jgi:hypothetical protein